MAKAAKQELYIIKIGGNVIDNSENLYHFLKDFKALKGYKILVHGGGKVGREIAIQGCKLEVLDIST